MATLLTFIFLSMYCSIASLENSVSLTIRFPSFKKSIKSASSREGYLYIYYAGQLQTGVFNPTNIGQEDAHIRKESIAEFEDIKW